MTVSDDANRGLSLVEVLDRLEAAVHDGEISVEDILRTFGPRAFGPLLLAPALLAIVPVIGALPGVSWACAALVTLFSLQFMLNSRRLWLPAFLRQAHLSEEMFRAAARRARPWFARIGLLFEPRLEALMHPVAVWLVSALCFVLGLLMFVFSLIPGGIVIPAAAVLLLALALTTHDGLVLLFGLVIAAAAILMVSSRTFSGALNALF